MKHALLSTLFVVGIFIFAAGSAFAQTSTVAGEWDGEFNTPGGSRPFKFVLAVEGEKLTGAAKRPNGDVPITGTIKDDVINFQYTISYNGNDVTMFFSGKVAADAMGGTISFNGQTEETWTARRSAN